MGYVAAQHHRYVTDLDAPRPVQPAPLSLKIMFFPLLPMTSERGPLLEPKQSERHLSVTAVSQTVVFSLMCLVSLDRF